MNRLILAFALTTALTTVASAQTVSDDVAKQLWCGTALVVAFSDVPPDAPADQQAQYDEFIAAGNELIEAAAQAHLDAGFTQAQVDQVKTDIVPVVTAQVTGTGDDAQYTFEECLEILPDGDAPADASSSAQ